MYEWLPFNAGKLDEVPQSRQDRREWLQHHLVAFRNIADSYRDKLVALYGEKRGNKIQYAEAFEGCEYGSPLTAENVKGLFPFF